MFSVTSQRQRERHEQFSSQGSRHQGLASRSMRPRSSMLTRAQGPTHASPTHLQPAIGLDDTRERYLHWGTHLRTETVESPTRHTPLSGSHGRDSPSGNHASPSPMRLHSSGRPRSASTPRGVLRLSQAASPPQKRPFSGVTTTANAGGPKHGPASPRPAHSSHRQALQPLSMNTAAIANATNVRTAATKLPQQGVATGVRHTETLPRGVGGRHPHPPSMAAPHAPAQQHVHTQNEHTGYGDLEARLGSEGQEEEGGESSWQRLKRWATARNERQGLGSAKSLGAVVAGGGGAGMPPPVPSASPPPAHNSVVRDQGGPGTLGGAVAEVLAAHMPPASHHIAPLRLAPPSPTHTSTAGGAWGVAAGAAAPTAAIASGAPTQQDNKPRASVPTAAGGLTAAAARLQRYQSELAQLDAALTTRASTQHLHSQLLHPLGGHHHARALSASHLAPQTVTGQAPSPRPHTSGGGGAGSHACAMPGCGEVRGCGSVGAVRSSGIESDLLAHYSASLAAAAARSGMYMGTLGLGSGADGPGDAATRGSSGGGHHYPRAACVPRGSDMGGMGAGGVMSHGGHAQGDGALDYDAMNLEQAAEALLARARAMAAAPGPKVRPAAAEVGEVGISGAWHEVGDFPGEDGSGGPPVASSSSAAAAAVGTAGTAFEGLESKGDVGEVDATVRRILEGAQLQLMHAQFDARRQELLGAAGLVLAEVQGGEGVGHLGVLSEEEVEEARAVAGVRKQLVLLVWRRAVRARAAAEVRAWMWRCQKRCAAVLRAWHDQAALGAGDRMAARQAAAERELGEQRMEEIAVIGPEDERKIQVAQRFRSLWLKHWALGAWREAAAEGTQARAEQARSLAAAAAQQQAEACAWAVAGRFRAAYLQHKALRGWGAQARAGRVQRVAATEDERRRAAIASFLCRAAGSAAPTATIAGCETNNRSAVGDTRSPPSLQDPPPHTGVQNKEANPAVPTTLPSSTAIAGMARAMGARGGMAAKLAASGIAARQARARLGGGAAQPERVNAQSAVPGPPVGALGGNNNNTVAVAVAAGTDPDQAPPTGLPTSRRSSGSSSGGGGVRASGGAVTKPHAPQLSTAARAGARRHRVLAGSVGGSALLAPPAPLLLSDPLAQKLAVVGGQEMGLLVQQHLDAMQATHETLASSQQQQQGVAGEGGGPPHSHAVYEVTPLEVVRVGGCGGGGGGKRAGGLAAADDWGPSSPGEGGTSGEMEDEEGVEAGLGVQGEGGWSTGGGGMSRGGGGKGGGSGFEEVDLAEEEEDGVEEEEEELDPAHPFHPLAPSHTPLHYCGSEAGSVASSTQTAGSCAHTTLPLTPAPASPRGSSGSSYGSVGRGAVMTARRSGSSGVRPMSGGGAPPATRPCTASSVGSVGVPSILDHALDTGRQKGGGGAWSRPQETTGPSIARRARATSPAASTRYQPGGPPRSTAGSTAAATSASKSARGGVGVWRRCTEGSLGAAAAGGDEDAARLLAQARAAEARRRRSTMEAVEAVSGVWMAEAMELADLHYQRSLLLRCGLRPWFSVLHAAHARMRVAMRAYHAHLLRTAWHTLRGEVTARRWKRAALQAARVGTLWQAAQRRHLAACFRRLRLWAVAGVLGRARCLQPALEGLKRAVAWSRLAVRDARLFCREKTQARLLRAWREAAAMAAHRALMLDLDASHTAQQHRAHCLMRAALTAWTDTVGEVRAAREAEQARAQTWGKIRGWLAEVGTTHLPPTQQPTSNTTAASKAAPSSAPWPADGGGGGGGGFDAPSVWNEVRQSAARRQSDGSADGTVEIKLLSPSSHKHGPHAAHTKMGGFWEDGGGEGHGRPHTLLPPPALLASNKRDPHTSSHTLINHGRTQPAAAVPCTADKGVSGGGRAFPPLPPFTRCTPSLLDPVGRGLPAGAGLPPRALKSEGGGAAGAAVTARGTPSTAGGDAQAGAGAGADMWGGGQRAHRATFSEGTTGFHDSFGVHSLGARTGGGEGGHAGREGEGQEAEEDLCGLSLAAAAARIRRRASSAEGAGRAGSFHSSSSTGGRGSVCSAPLPPVFPTHTNARTALSATHLTTLHPIPALTPHLAHPPASASGQKGASSVFAPPQSLHPHWPTPSGAPQHDDDALPFSQLPPLPGSRPGSRRSSGSTTGGGWGETGGAGRPGAAFEQHGGGVQGWPRVSQWDPLPPLQQPCLSSGGDGGGQVITHGSRAGDCHTGVMQAPSFGWSGIRVEVQPGQGGGVGSGYVQGHGAEEGGDGGSPPGQGPPPHVLDKLVRMRQQRMERVLRERAG